MNSFVKRFLTGVAIVTVIAALILAGPFTFVLLFLILHLLGLLEFYRLFHSPTLVPRKVLGAILSAALFLSSALIVGNLFDWRIVLVTIPLGAMIFVQELYRRSETPFQNLAFTFLGITFVTFPFMFLTGLAFLPFWSGTYQPHIILGYFLLLWTNDTLAYIVGSRFGKHPLFERISPKKTWEGSVGGGLCTLLMAFLISHYVEQINPMGWLVVAVLVIVFGTLGDLVKSLMKRSLNIKDSGNLLPGHGGILDRFDSLIGSAPFVFAYVSLTMPTVI